jgi:hypothetical protein
VPRSASFPVDGGLAFHFPEGKPDGYDVHVRFGTTSLVLLRNLPLPPEKEPPPAPESPGGVAVVLRGCIGETP